jgi:hypothetical protein
VFTAFGIGYRFAMWLRRQPTRKYWFQGWKIFLRPARLAGNIFRLVQLFLRDLVAQRFIEKPRITLQQEGDAIYAVGVEV